MSLPADFDPALDLAIDRVLPVSAAKIWRAWTRPEHLMQWFCPRPWRVTECEVDLRPGGRFRFVMHGPNEGEVSAHEGCYLEIVPEKVLIWTDTLLPGYRPSLNPFFTALLYLEPHPEGTRYLAIARHGTREVRDNHEQMGFYEGWNTVADQLVELCQGLGD